ARFEPRAVRALTDHDLVAAPRRGQDRELVSHGAGRHEERRLLPAQRGDALLERAHRRILAVHVVADLGPRHRLAPRGRRTGDGVGAEADRVQGFCGAGSPFAPPFSSPSAFVLPLSAAPSPSSSRSFFSRSASSPPSLPTSNVRSGSCPPFISGSFP